MAMSVGNDGGEDAPMNEINTTPLVDVMLVLLIIFLIAVPVVIKTVKLNLPVLAYQPTVSKAENIILSVKSDGAGGCEVYMNATRLTGQKLYEIASKRYKSETERLGPAEAADPENYPEVHVRGDQRTAWKCVGGVIYQVQMAGFLRVGFISSPNAIG